MEFQKVLALRGPNIWASFPVLEAWVDLGELKDLASSELPGFNDRLTSWLPTLIEHRCSMGTRGGFFERLRRGTYLAHILEHVALELQSLAGTAVGFGRTRQAKAEGVYKVAIEYQDEEVGRGCLEAARELCLAAVSGQPWDVAAEVSRLRALAQRVCPPRSVAAILAAARDRKIPVRRLGPEGLVQLGYGAQQRRLLGRLTDAAGAVAESVVQDNELTRTLLQAAGIPVPKGRPVADAADAWAAAKEVGLPALVKPRYGHRRRGTVRELSSREQVLAAYEAAKRETSYLLVERQAAGGDFRLLVVGGRVVAAARRQPGGAEDVTDHVHPQVAARVSEAAGVVGLEIAGVDVIVADLTRPLEEQGGVVVGIHPRPGLALHRHPAAGSPRPVGQAILDHLFPQGQSGRIPIVGVTGVNGKTTTTRLITHILGLAGRRVGMTCTEGIYLDTRRLVSGDCSGPQSAGWVLQNPQVEAAVLETARGGILRAGLGFDYCDVAVVTNIGEGDHLGRAEIDTLEQLAWVKSTLVAAVAPGGAAVLRADDPHVVWMAQHCRGAVIYFALDGGDPVLARHRADGGRAAFVRDNHIILADGQCARTLAFLERVPLTHGGRVGFQVLNALAAAAAAWGLGIAPEVIRAGLESFAGRLDTTPGRFNLLEINGATVVLDYGHNVSALACLIETLERFPHRRRSIVFSGSGDRRDSDLIRQGEMLGQAFDEVILYEDPRYLRGLEEGRMTALFRQGLQTAQRVREVREVRSWHKAVEAALAVLRPGDLLVIQPDVIDETVALVRQHLAAREVDLNEAVAGPQPEPDAVVCPGAGVEVR